MPVLANDAILGIGFEFDEAAFNQKVENLLRNAGVKISQETAKVVSQQKQQNDSIVNTARQANTSIGEITAKRVALEKELHFKSFKEVEKGYEDFKNKVLDKREQIRLESDKITKRGLQDELRALQAQTAAWRREYSSREEVMRKGAGTQFGILGTGRNLITAGGSLIGQASGILGVSLGTAEIIKMGKAADHANYQMLGSFKTAGATAEQASLLVKQVTKDYEAQGMAIGLTAQEFKNLTNIAAFSGHFLGDANKQLVVAAGAIEKQTQGKEGEVNADRFIRAISQGINSDEGKETFGRLRMSMPAFVHDLEQASDKEDLFRRAIKGSNEAVQAQIKWMDSDEAAIERETIRRENQAERIGQLANKWIGSILHAAKNIDVTLDELLGTLDVHDAEERKIMEAHVKQLEKDLQREKDLHGANVQGVESMLNAYKKELSQADETKKSIDGLNTSLVQNKQVTDGATASAEALVAGFTAEQMSIDKDYTNKRAVYIEAKKDFDKYKNTGWGSWAKWQLDQAEVSLKKSGAAYNQFSGMFDAADKLAGRGANEVKGKDLNRSEFEKEKSKLEDQMHSEQTLVELGGIAQNKTKTEIEIESLNIEIKYSRLIAESAKNNAQLKNSYLLTAAKDEERIREIGLEQKLKNEETHFKFELSTADKYDKQRMELTRAFTKDFQNASYESGLELWEMYKTQWNSISDDEQKEKLSKQNELQKRLLEVEMKGIELRIKSHKHDTDLDLSLENDRYEKALDIQKNYYAKAIIDAKADETLLRIAKDENNVAERNLLIEHLSNLKKITEDAHQDIRNIFEGAISSEMAEGAKAAFQPWQDEVAKTHDVLSSFLLSVAKGFADLAAKKVATGLFNKIFKVKDEEGNAIADQTVANSKIPLPLPYIAPPESTPGKEGYADSSFENATFKTVTVENLTVGGSLISDNSSIIGGGLPPMITDMSRLKRGDNTGTHDLQGTNTMSSRELNAIMLGAHPNELLREGGDVDADGNPKSEYQKRLKKHYKKMQEFMDREDVAKGLSKGWDLDSSVGGAHPEFINLPGILGKGFGTSTLDEWRNIRQDKDPNSERWSMDNAIGKGIGNPETLAMMMPDHWLLEPTIKELSYSLNKKDIPKDETPGLLSLISSAPSLLTTDASVVGNTTSDDSKKTKDAEKTGITIGKTLIDLGQKGAKKGGDPTKDLLEGGLSLAANAILPGLGSLIGPLGSLLGFDSGGDIPGTDTGRDNVLVKARRGERILTPPQARDYDRTMTSMRKVVESYDMHSAARAASYSGGSQLSDTSIMKHLIESNHAIGHAIDNINWRIEGSDIRALSNKAYADTIGKKFG